MKNAMVFFIIFILGISLAYAEDGLKTIKSAHGVKETADRLETILKEKGMAVFARINHSEGAATVGIDMPATELVIFGNPKVGSPLMKCNRSVGIDLPQKALIWKDGNGQVWFSYNDPQYLAKRHDLSDCVEVLKKVEKALASFSRAATAQ